MYLGKNIQYLRKQRNRQNSRQLLRENSTEPTAKERGIWNYETFTI